MFLLLFDVPMTLHSKIRTCSMVFLWDKYSGEISQMQTALEAPGKSIERWHILGYFAKIWVIIGIIFSKMLSKVQYSPLQTKSLKSTTGSNWKVDIFSKPTGSPLQDDTPTDYTPKRRNWKVREAVAPKHQHSHREWTAWNTSKIRCGGTPAPGSLCVNGLFHPHPG